MRSLTLLALLALTGAVVAQTVSFTPSQSAGKADLTAQADLNGDGILDIVSVRTDSGGKTGFYVTLSNSQGGYNPPVFYSSPYNNGSNASVALGDFNNDGKVDVVEVEGTADYYVFLNRGDGTFVHSWNFPTPGGSGNFAVATADFNHDGKLDLVLGDNSGQLKLLYGNGHGTFSAPFKIAGPIKIGSLFIGDYDSDGNADVAVAYVQPCSYCSTTVSVYYGDGHGDFSVPSTDSFAGSIHFVSDNVDGNQYSDLMGTGFTPNPNSLLILHGNADRTFTEQDLTLENRGYAPVAADFNGDGIRDLALIEVDPSGNDDVVVLLGNSDGSYQQETQVYSLSGATGLLAGRYNHDTKPDLVTASVVQSAIPNDTFDFLFNTTSGIFSGCNPPNSAAGISVCSPASGSTVTSPVKFSVAASYTSPLRKTELWVDGIKLTESFNSDTTDSFLDGTFNLAQGSHRADVYSAAYDNRLQHTSFTFTVGNTSSLQYDVSLFNNTSQGPPVGQVTIDNSGKVTVQLAKGGASTTYAVEFCPAPAQLYSTCISLGNVTTNAGGAVTGIVTFPAGIWAGDFELFENGQESYVTSVTQGVASTYYATLEPQSEVNGKGTWTQGGAPPPQDPLQLGFVTLNSSGLLDVNVVGAASDKSYDVVQCPLYQGSDCYTVGTASKNEFTTDSKGNAFYESPLETNLPEDIFYVNRVDGLGFGFIGGFRIP